MSQTPNNRNINRRFSNTPPSGDGKTPRRKTGVSLYWIYGIIAAVILGYQFLGPRGSAADMQLQDFFNALRSGEISKFQVIVNKEVVKVTLTERRWRWISTKTKNCPKTSAVR